MNISPTSDNVMKSDSPVSDDSAKNAACIRHGRAMTLMDNKGTTQIFLSHPHGMDGDTSGKLPDSNASAAPQPTSRFMAAKAPTPTEMTRQEFALIEKVCDILERAGNSAIPSDESVLLRYGNELCAEYWEIDFSAYGELKDEDLFSHVQEFLKTPSTAIIKRLKLEQTDAAISPKTEDADPVVERVQKILIDKAMEYWGIDQPQYEKKSGGNKERLLEKGFALFNSFLMARHKTCDTCSDAELYRLAQKFSTISVMPIADMKMPSFSDLSDADWDDSVDRLVNKGMQLRAFAPVAGSDLSTSDEDYFYSVAFIGLLTYMDTDLDGLQRATGAFYYEKVKEYTAPRSPSPSNAIPQSLPDWAAAGRAASEAAATTPDSNDVEKNTQADSGFYDAGDDDDDGYEAAMSTARGNGTKNTDGNLPLQKELEQFQEQTLAVAKSIEEFTHTDNNREGDSQEGGEVESAAAAAPAPDVLISAAPMPDAKSETVGAISLMDMSVDQLDALLSREIHSGKTAANVEKEHVPDKDERRTDIQRKSSVTPKQFERIVPEKRNRRKSPQAQFVPRKRLRTLGTLDALASYASVNRTANKPSEVKPPSTWTPRANAKRQAGRPHPYRRPQEVMPMTGKGAQPKMAALSRAQARAPAPARPGPDVRASVLAWEQRSRGIAPQGIAAPKRTQKILPRYQPAAAPLPLPVKTRRVSLPVSSASPASAPTLVPKPARPSAPASTASVRNPGWVQVGHGQWKKREDVPPENIKTPEAPVELTVQRRTHTRIAGMLERQQQRLRAMQPDLAEALAADERLATARDRLRKRKGQ